MNRLQQTLGEHRGDAMAARARASAQNPIPPPTYAPPGWRLLTKAEYRELGIPATRRAAVDPSGDVVPYVQYLNAQARQSGFSSHEDYRKHAKALSYFRRPDVNKANADLSLGGENLKLYHEAIVVGKGKDTSPHGPLARFLEMINPEKRPRGSTYEVGDTP